MTASLTVVGSAPVTNYNRDQIDLLKRTICADATDDEFALFLEVSQRTGLNPFARQIFAVKRWDTRAGRDVMTIQTSIDGFRLIAERSGRYAGQLGPFWSADGREWLEVWLDNEHPPAAAKVAVLRSDFKEPLWSVATWDQYRQETKQGGLTPMWRRMGPLMLAKCAESLALRRAFPQELSGLYTAEEMQQAVRGGEVDVLTGEVMPVEIATPKPLPPLTELRTIGEDRKKKVWKVAAVRVGELIARGDLAPGSKPDTIMRDILKAWALEHTADIPTKQYDAFEALVLRWMPGMLPEEMAEAGGAF